MPRKGARRRPASEQDELVAGALKKEGRPMSAYELIDTLREEAVLAPQTVYRSLDRLIADGKAHRLESLNAFVACNHPRHEGVAVFAICEDCGTVTEFDQPDAVARLAEWAEAHAFGVREMTLELRGQCSRCTARG